MLAWLLLATHLLAANVWGQPARSAPEPATASGALQTARGTSFMAVTANPHASHAARQVLARGGSAVDAAVASQMVLGLVEPQSSGIGGGGFLLYWDAQREHLHAYDGRETAPSTVKPDLFLDSEGQPLSFWDAVIGGRAVGVPGVIAMLAMAHQEHGILPWEELFTPAIELAEQGFLMSPRLVQLLKWVPRVAVRTEIRELFFDDQDQPWPAGHRLRNPAYAASLRLIARQGPDAFYRGPLASAMAATVQNDADNPGQLTIADLASYRARKRSPLCGEFRGSRICSMPPPSSGGTTLLSLLGILGHLQPERWAPESPQFLHLLAESSKLAYADRNAWLGDPEFATVPVAGLVNADYLQQRATLIHPRKVLKPGEAGLPPGAELPLPPPARARESSSTTHLSIVDRQGNVLSMTSSIENAFGSRLMVGGFLLNNQLTDFDFLPTSGKVPVPNRVQPGKRPLSSMSPVIVLDGNRPRLATGSPGGKKIIAYVARILAQHLIHEQPLTQAVANGHVVQMHLRPLELEKDRFEDGVIKALEALGHQVKEQRHSSGLHSILLLPDGSLQGIADPRREGTAVSDQEAGLD